MHLHTHTFISHIICNLCPWSRTKSSRRNKNRENHILTYFHNTDNKCMAISSHNFSWFVPIQKTSQRKIRSIPTEAQKYSYKFTYLIRSNDS